MAEIHNTRAGKLLDQVEKNKKAEMPVKNDWRLMTAELREGDGINPREDRKLKQRDKSDVYAKRDMQLGKQIAHNISLVLSNLGDPDLGDLYVKAVQKTNGCPVFNVTLAPNPGVIDINIPVLIDKLNRVKNYIRSELVGSISRKKIPDLSFSIEPGE